MDQVDRHLPPSALRARLSRAGIVPEPAIWTPLSGGRSSRVWRVDTSPPLVVKVAGGRLLNDVFPEDVTVEYLCLRHLSGTGLAPEPVTSDPESPLQPLVYCHLAGPSPDPGAGPAAIARCLAALHRHPPPGGLRQTSADLDATTRDLLASLRPDHRALLPPPPTSGGIANPPVFLHGDPVTANFVQVPGGLSLIDWSCAAVGPAALDHAVALSPAMGRLYGGDVDAGWRRAYLAALPQEEADAYRRLAPLLHLRLAAYCLWRAERGEPDYRAAADLEIALLEHL